MIPDNPDSNTLTHVVAAGAAVSPLWLNHLSELSQTALPILGVAWLLIQAAVYIYKNFYIVKKLWQKVRKP